MSNTTFSAESRSLITNWVKKNAFLNWKMTIIFPTKLTVKWMFDDLKLGRKTFKFLS